MLMSVCCTYKNTWGLHCSVCLKQHREGSSPSRSRGQPWTPGSPPLPQQGDDVPHPAAEQREAASQRSSDVGGPSPNQTAAAGLDHAHKHESILHPWCREPRENSRVGCVGTRTPKRKGFQLVCTFLSTGTRLCLHPAGGAWHRAPRQSSVCNGKCHREKIYHICVFLYGTRSCLPKAQLPALQHFCQQPLPSC